MNQALQYLYDIYSVFLDLIFNQFEIIQNVSIGWIMIVIIVFGLMINNIMNLPKSVNVKRSKNG